MRERPLSNVPVWALLLLATALALQVGSYYLRPPSTAEAQTLAAPPSRTAFTLAGLGETVPVARASMLYLQAFDTQPGVRLAYARLDYGRVEAWLARIMELDPRSNYPLLVAGNVYGIVPDPARKRSMYEFIYRQFLLDPNRRWRQLAEAATQARHSLKDLALARKYTEALRLHATGPDVPAWARRMDIFLRADMGEVASARMLLGAMYDSGALKDRNEIAFVMKRLAELEANEKR